MAVDTDGLLHATFPVALCLRLWSIFVRKSKLLVMLTLPVHRQRGAVSYYWLLSASTVAS